LLSPYTDVGVIQNKRDEIVKKDEERGIQEPDGGVSAVSCQNEAHHLEVAIRMAPRRIWRSGPHDMEFPLLVIVTARAR